MGIHHPLKHRSLCAVLAVPVSGFTGISHAAPDALLASVPESFKFSAGQHERLLASGKEDPKIPRTFEKGALVTVGPKDGTSGFFPGSLWYLYDFIRVRSG